MLATLLWTNPAGGDWSVASNWDLNRLPNSSDDVVIPDLAGAGNDLTIRFETGSATVKNLMTAETVAVNGGTLVNTGNTSGLGTVTIAGGTLAMTGIGWTNTSTIVLNSGVLSLDGSFTQAGLGTSTPQAGQGKFTRNGGTVNLVGTITNGVNLNAATGSWNLIAGTIDGGTITTDSTNPLVAKGFGFSYLTNGVTIAAGGVLDMTDADKTYSRVIVTGGLTINGKLLLGGGDLSSLVLNNTQTIGGSGEIVGGKNGTFATQIQGPITFTFASTLNIHGPAIRFSGEGSGASNPTYKIQGPINIEAGGSGLFVDSGIGTFETSGTISLLAGTSLVVTPKTRWNHSGIVNAPVGNRLDMQNLVNKGIIETFGAAVTFLGSITQSNIGTAFPVAAQGKFTRSGGTVNISGTVTGGLTLDSSTGSWNLRSGTIAGGTISTDAANRLIADGFAYSYLTDGVTIAAGGVLDMTDADKTYSRVVVTGGLTINGKLLLGGGDLSSLVLNDTQTIGGSGEIVGGKNGAFATQIQGPITFTFASTLNIHGPAIRFSGEGSGASNPTYKIQGPINIEAGGSGLFVDSGVGTFETSGTITLANATTLAVTPKTRWNHSGIVNAPSGNKLDMQNLVNTGEINTSGATANLLGSVTQSNVGAAVPVAGQGKFTRNGGAVNINGTVTGGLILDDTTGPWNLVDGTIDGGTITTDATNWLVVGGSHDGGQFINGVTVSVGSTVDMTGLIGASGGTVGVLVSVLRVTDGMTLNGTLLLGQETVGGNVATLLLGNTQTIGGTGKIVFGASTNSSIATRVQGPITFTFAPTLTIRGKSIVFEVEGSGASNPTYIVNGPLIVDAGGSGGKVRFGAGTFNTNGTVTVPVSTSLDIEAKNGWNHTGVLNVEGVVNVASTTLHNLSSGALAGGTWNLGGGGIVRVPNSITTNKSTITIDGPNSKFYRGTVGTIDALATLTQIDATGSLILKNGGQLSPLANITNAGSLIVASGSTLGLPQIATDTISRYSAESNAQDSAGINHGTLKAGTNFASGIQGQAFSLNGTTQYVEIPDSPSLRPSNLTVSTWFNFSGTSSLASIVAKPIGNSFQDSYTLYYQSGALNAGIAVGTSTSSTFVATSAAYTIDPGVWHQVAMTFDDVADTLLLYVDGVLRASTTTGQSIAYDSRPLVLGTDIENGSLDYFFPGKIDETTIFNRPLSPTEIKSIFDAQSRPPITFTQSGGTTTVDGTLRFKNGVQVNGGTLDGTGRIDANVTNSSGVVAPGSPLGKLTIDGNYSQAAAGSLNFEIGGTVPGIQHDQLQVSGTATLGGTLNVSLANGYGPEGGQVYNVLTANSVSGSFATTNVPSIGGSSAFGSQITSTAVNLVGATTAADLAVQSVSFVPNAIIPGSNLQVNYQIQNRGTVAATGSWTDRAYLSIDGTLSSDDLFFGSKTHFGDLAGLASYSDSITAPVPGLSDATYRVIVVTDAGKQSPDAGRGNNTFAAPAPLAIRTRELEIGTPYSGDIVAGQDIYFRVNVPPGSNVQISADFAVAFESELLIKYASVPTRSLYDLTARDVADLHPTILLPAGRGGAYYILLHGREGAATSKAYTIRAESVPFGVSQYGPTTGGNGGNVTLTLEGAGFSPDTKVTLKKGTSILTPLKTNVIDGNHLTATFEMSGKAPGNYILHLVDGFQSSDAATPFELQVAPLEPNIRVKAFQTPSLIRVGSGFGFLVTIENFSPFDVQLPLFQAEGTNNVAAPKVKTKNGGTLTAYDPTGASETWKTTFGISFGPKPAAAGTTSNAGFSAVDPMAPVDWNSTELDTKPVTITDEAWHVIFQNYTNVLGTTVESLQKLLQEDTEYFVKLGLPEPELQQVLDFEKSKANAELPVSTLDSAVDLAYPEPGLPLVYARTYVQSISGRYHLGSLGRGWVSNWDISVIPDSKGFVFVQSGTATRQFFATGTNGVYKALGTDTGTLTLAAGRYTLRETDGSVTAFLPDNQLDYLADKYGTRITANYSGLVTTFTHSNGDALTIRRNSDGRVVEVSDPSNRIVSYNYDVADEHLVGVSTAQGQYTYSYIVGQGAPREHALASSTNSTGTHVEYAYDPKGRLTSISDGGSSVTYAYLYPGGYTVNDGSGTTIVQVDINGRPVSIEDAAHHLTKIKYDVNGQPVLITAPDTTSSTSIAYDNAGNPIRSVNPLNNATQGSFETKYRNLLSFQNELGKTTTFNYNSVGDLQSTVLPDNSSTLVSTNAQGLINQATNARGQTANFTYDARGLLTQATYPDGTTTLYLRCPRQSSHCDGWKWYDHARL